MIDRTQVQLPLQILPSNSLQVFIPNTALTCTGPCSSFIFTCMSGTGTSFCQNTAGANITINSTTSSSGYTLFIPAGTFTQNTSIQIGAILTDMDGQTDVEMFKVWVLTATAAQPLMVTIASSQPNGYLGPNNGLELICNSTDPNVLNFNWSLIVTFNGQDVSAQINNLSQNLANGIYNFPPSSFPSQSLLMFTCIALFGNETGKSTPLAISTIPPFNVSANVFPTTVTPTTPATITIYNLGNSYIECIPRQYTFGPQGNIIDTVTLRSTYIPVPSGSSVQISTVFFTNPNASYVATCRSQSDITLSMDFALSITVITNTTSDSTNIDNLVQSVAGNASTDAETILSTFSTVYDMTSTASQQIIQMAAVEIALMTFNYSSTNDFNQATGTLWQSSTLQILCDFLSYEMAAMHNQSNATGA